MSPMPKARWSEISIDFFGPIAPTKEYWMVVLDDFSRYVLVEVIHSLTAEVVIKHLSVIFGTFGIPDQVRTDNGTPFNSKDFALIS